MEEFRQLEGRASACENLSDLFSLWKMAQQSEKNPRETFPMNGKCLPDDSFAGSFCHDGSLGGGDRHKILFVCRESRLSDADNVISEPNTDESFWMRAVVEANIDDVSYPGTDLSSSAKGKSIVQKSEPRKYVGTELSSSAKGAQTKYRNCLKRLASVKDCQDLTKCAYMNINKRGGYRGTDLNQLVAYAKTYEAFILKEIELLRCEQIIVCGKLDGKGFILDALRKAGRPIFVYPRHPSRYSSESIEDEGWQSVDLSKTLG
jgi:hypothetical protein